MTGCTTVKFGLYIEVVTESDIGVKSVSDDVVSLGLSITVVIEFELDTHVILFAFGSEILSRCCCTCS